MQRENYICIEELGEPREPGKAKQPVKHKEPEEPNEPWRSKEPEGPEEWGEPGKSAGTNRTPLEPGDFFFF